LTLRQNIVPYHKRHQSSFPTSFSIIDENVGSNEIPAKLRSPPLKRGTTKEDFKNEEKSPVENDLLTYAITLNTSEESLLKLSIEIPSSPDALKFFLPQNTSFNSSESVGVPS